MGKRRIRNLISIGYSADEIIGIDIKKERRVSIEENFGIKTYEKIEENFLKFVDIFIISTPPDAHFESALIGLQNNKHIFIEASVMSRGLYELSSEANKRNLIAFPSCTMRYFDGPKGIKKVIHEGLIGKPLFWQYQSGQYLPDWHPWESIEDFYVSNPETGGCREIVPFELGWLEDIFGSFKEVDCRAEKISDLPIGIHDVYLLTLKHDSGVLGQLAVDVLSRVPIRLMRITGVLGTLEWSDNSNTIRIFDLATGVWSEHLLKSKNLEKNYINSENPYEDEVKNFLNVVARSVPLQYTLEHDIEILKVLEAAELASSLRSRVDII